jgi:uroporphyrinogen III methyltransferase/synthase
LVAAIGPITAKTLADHGFSANIQPEEYTVPALVEAVAETLGKKHS